MTLHDPVERQILISPCGRFRLFESQTFGRHLFSDAYFRPGELIDRVPVIVLPDAQNDDLRRTDLYAYVFEWDPQERYKQSGDLVQCDGRYSQAVALGLISFCNHRDDPNADYSFDYANQLIIWTARRLIEPGDEITIHYKVPLWFRKAEV